MKRAVMLVILILAWGAVIFGNTTETSISFSLSTMPDIRTNPEGYARWKAEYARSLSRRSLARAESPMELRVNNGYVEAVVDNASGEFDEGGDPTGSGAYVKLTYSYTTWSGYSGGTEWVMYYVDGYTAKTDADLPAPDACYTSGDTVITIWNNWHGVRIRQEILPVSLGATPGASEQILFRAKMYSADGAEHECGCIVYYDTMLRDHDDARISTAFGYTGIAQIFFATDSLGVPPIWHAYEVSFPPSPGDLVATGILRGWEAEPPDVFWYGSWPSSVGNGWDDADWIADTGDSFGDSAAMVKWYPRTVSAADSVVFATYYGIGVVEGDFVFDHTPPELTASCADVHPNPMPLTVQISNGLLETVNDVYAYLDLAGTDLELVSGDNPAHFDSIAGFGGTQVVEWDVLATPDAYGTTQCYTITVVSTPDSIHITDTFCVDIPELITIDASVWADEYWVEPGASVGLHSSVDWSGGTEDLTYHWEPASLVDDPSSPNPTATVDTTTTFVLTVSDTGDCIGIDSVTIFMQKLDTVWFSEETECDGQNVVEICYTLRGEPGEISVVASTDGGTSWDAPLVSLEDADGDIGEAISAGTHCFSWVISDDIENFETESLMVRVNLLSIADTFVIVDSIDISPRSEYGHGLAYGDGYYWIYDSRSGYVYRAACVDYHSCPPIDSFYIGTYNCDIDYNDGYIYYCTNSTDADDDTVWRINVEDGSLEMVFISTEPMNVQGIQVLGDYVYLSLCTSHEEWALGRVEMSSIPTSEIDTVIYTAGGACYSQMEGMASAMGYLWGCNNDGIIGQIDPYSAEEAECHPVPNIGYGAEGLCWDGHYMWYHNSGTEKIYQIVISEVPPGEVIALGPVDTRPPVVSPACPTDTVQYGDTISVAWTVDDMFPNTDEPCTVLVNYCVGEDTFITGDAFDWSPEPVVCESAYIAVAAPDSFCNWGYDTCYFAIVSAGSMVVHFPETSAYACDTIVVPITISDAYLPLARELRVYFSVNGAIITPLEFANAVSPAPDSVYFGGDGNHWSIQLFWTSRVFIESDSLGALTLAVNCAASGGDFSPLHFDSVGTDLMDIITDDGLVAINYSPAQWLQILRFDDVAGVKPQRTLGFGNAFGATDNYDAAYDIIYVTPPPSEINVWFVLDDPEHPAIRALSRDVRDTIPVNTWVVANTEDNPLYVHWNPDLFSDGLYLLNGHQDMRADTDYVAEPGETLVITWSLPEWESAEITLYPGWNLVSIPVENPSGSPESIFPGIFFGPLGYDAETRSFYLADHIESGRGYWVFSLNETQLPLIGLPVHHYEKRVYPGWNLMGATIDTVSVDETAVSEGSVISAFEYDPSTAGYYPSSTLVPGKGYWMWISGSGILMVPAE